MENKEIKILAIDDNNDNLITLKAIIAEVLPDSMVYTALNGLSGIESAKKHNPDVILLDIVMPGMDGYQVCKILKEDQQLAEIPVVFLTALKGDKQSRILALKAGGEAFLAKPIDTVELEAQILAMVKIKKAAEYKRNEKSLLEWEVLKRTDELQKANIATLNLLEDLNVEKEKLKLLNRAVESSSASVIITDASGNIIYVNPNFTQISGYSADELIGRKLRILNQGKLSGTDSEELWKTILSGKDWKGEYQNRRKNGEYYWEIAIISPILDKNGEISNFIAIKDDITEKKKILEELVKAKEKAEESDLLKTAFLQNLLHEIRTPMNGILGFVELLKDPALTGENRDKFIEIVEMSGQRLLHTINDIIEISKIDSGVVDVISKDENVYEILLSHFNFFMPEISKKNLKFKLDFQLSDKNIRVQTDRFKLDIIFMNLINNSIKFTKQGSIEIGCYKESNNLVFYVKDTGLGIPANKLDIIFGRFVQADLSLTRGYEGSGLGLSISKAYAEMLGGKIWVNSVQSQGSAFYFSIPVTGLNIG